jgi:hypothetical protein
MATTAQTIEKVAPAVAAAGLTPGGLDRLMRSLKEANDPDLMPKARKGGGTGGVDLQTRHHMNFAFAIMAADTIAEAPSVVPIYRALIPIQVTRTQVEYGDDNQVILRTTSYGRGHPPPLYCMKPWDDPPDTDLGQALENILRNYDALPARPISECLVWRAHPWVEITFHITPFIRETWGFGPAPDLLAPLSAPWTLEKPAGVCFSAPTEMFRVLADLVRDAERDHGHKSSSDAAGGAAGADTETATPAAGGTGPASVDDIAGQPGCSPVNPDDVTSHQDSGKKKRRQRSAPSAPHGPPSTAFMDQWKDVPPWQKSNLPMGSAG